MAGAVVGLALQGAPVGCGGLARLVLRLTQQAQVEGGAAVLRIARQGRQDLLFGSRQVVAAQQDSAQVAVRRGKLRVAAQGLAIGLFRARHVVLLLQHHATQIGRPRILGIRLARAVEGLQGAGEVTGPEELFPPLEIRRAALGASRRWSCQEQQGNDPRR